MRNIGKTSPLYTPKDLAKAKRAFIAHWGKDSDGAFRYFGRIDADKTAKVAA